MSDHGRRSERLPAVCESGAAGPDGMQPERRGPGVPEIPCASGRRSQRRTPAAAGRESSNGASGPRTHQTGTSQSGPQCAAGDAGRGDTGTFDDDARWRNCPRSDRQRRGYGRIRLSDHPGGISRLHVRGSGIAQSGQAPPEFLSTHPSNESRIQDLKNYLPTAKMYAKKYNQPVFQVKK